MRLVKHSNPDAMIDDGMCHDDHDTQGRTPESVRGTEENLYVLFWVGVVLVCAIILYAIINGGGAS